MSSPTIQPILHISTALAYFVDPRRISGARYHLVATYSVLTGLSPSSVTATDLANPKSASLTRHSEFNRIFDGFKSLWMSSPEWIYFIALRIKYTTYYLCISSRIFARITTCKSVSMKSNTMYKSLLFSALMMLMSRMMFSWPLSS